MKIWRAIAIVFMVIALIEFVLLMRDRRPELLGSTAATKSKADHGFETFEGIMFAREFSERYQTFDSSNFKVTQVATSFLLDDSARAVRLAEIDRLVEKIERREVAQRARLVTLLKLPESADRFRSELEVELTEGGGKPTSFATRIDFSLKRSNRSEQNPWGFHATDLSQAVTAGEATQTGTTFAMRAGVAMLLRFPCSIENVELPKATSIRVKLTTLDVSELQLKTADALSSPQVVRAVCRDRAFTMTLTPEAETARDSEPLVVLKSLTLADSTEIAASKNKSHRRKTDVEKSVEDQLGFIIEEE